MLRELIQLKLSLFSLFVWVWRQAKGFQGPFSYTDLLLEPMQTSFVRHSHSSIFSLKWHKCISITQKPTKQLILTEQDQFLCQCEAAISIQQQPLQADWLAYQWFWQMSKRKSRRRRPLSTVYIFLYIFKLRFNLPSHLSFDSFLLTHGKIKNCRCGSIVGKSGCQSPPALHIYFFQSVASL